MMTDFEPFDDDLATALQRRVPDMGEATLFFGVAYQREFLNVL